MDEEKVPDGGDGEDDEEEPHVGGQVVHWWGESGGAGRPTSHLACSLQLYTPPPGPDKSPLRDHLSASAWMFSVTLNLGQP